jgi:hypothetical protein
MTIYFVVKTLIRNKASRCRLQEWSVLKFKQSKLNHNYVEYQTGKTMTQIVLEYFIFY